MSFHNDYNDWFKMNDPQHCPVFQNLPNSSRGQMSRNQVNMYSVDPHIAEIYDQLENDSEDVDLLLRLIGSQGQWNIFEPFCGTGRILLPLAKAGHHLTGLDQSSVLLNRCREKLNQSGLQATLIEGDVIADPWYSGFDLIVMGGNCLYELASPEEQEHCIRAAAAALKPGGFLFLDNDHMEGELALHWRDTTMRSGFPSGVCADGVRLESTTQVVWFDVHERLARFQRSTKSIYPDGAFKEYSYIQQKHPVSTGEIHGWLDKYSFIIDQLYGSRGSEVYTDESPRAIFWARKIA